MSAQCEQTRATISSPAARKTAQHAHSVDELLRSSTASGGRRPVAAAAATAAVLLPPDCMAGWLQNSNAANEFGLYPCSLPQRTTTRKIWNIYTHNNSEQPNTHSLARPRSLSSFHIKRTSEQ